MISKHWKLLLICGLLFPMIGNAQVASGNDIVLAWKSQTPYIHGASGWPSMNYTRWLETHVWLTGGSAILYEGTTNAQWICHAKTCAGNAVQTTSNRQPIRVNTNGVWVLKFDGSDDYISFPSPNIISGTNSFTIIGKITPQQGTSRIICSQWDYLATNRQWLVQMSGGALSLASSTDGSAANTTFSTVASNLVPTAEFTFKIARSGANISWQINGTNVTSSGGCASTIPSFNPRLFIGAQGTLTSPAGFYGGNIEYLHFFKGSL